MNNKMYVACCGNPDDDFVSGIYFKEENVQEWFKQAVSDMLDMMQDSGHLFKIILSSNTDFYIEDQNGDIYYVRYESAVVKDND